MNPALEAQAVGRVHRMGQKREVFVKRLVMKDSVEAQIMKLSTRKMKGAALPVGQGSAADGADGDDNGAAAAAAAAASSSSSRGRKRGREQKVNASDFAGAIKADKLQMKTEELEVLFA